jgi:hypothetical protein
MVVRRFQRFGTAVRVGWALGGDRCVEAFQDHPWRNLASRRVIER